MRSDGKVQGDARYEDEQGDRCHHDPATTLGGLGHDSSRDGSPGVTSRAMTIATMGPRTGRATARSIRTTLFPVVRPARNTTTAAGSTRSASSANDQKTAAAGFHPASPSSRGFHRSSGDPARRSGGVLVLAPD